MKIIPCPMNGPRPAQEFICLGEVKTMPDTATCDDAEWTAYVFVEPNLRGAVREWWCHVPTHYWFIAERDTATDTISRTYDPSEIFGAEAKERT